MSSSNNIHHQSFHLSKELFAEQYKHKAKVFWFTGLSGSGKSTLANEVSKILFLEGTKVFILDGDNTRLGINKDLGFTLIDRKENIRRVAEIAKLFGESGTVVLTSFISPMIEDRDMAKEIIGAENFFEIFIDCSIEVCEERDVKGLYAKARRGEIKSFTGIDSPFEKPIRPDIIVNTAQEKLEDCIQKIYSLVKKEIYV